ncbi:hypothetical protein AB67_5524 [Escherichia coli 5-366-08_S1_C3]|nr:hypothetical protein AB67_5524 [Escherichia coli 5-366-08_S1_C3]
MKEHQLIELVGFYWPDKAFTPHPAQTIKYYRTINPRISSRPLKSGA